MSNCVQVAMDDKELRLASELKKLCTRAYGEERKETLSESAKVLFDLGKLYLQKATYSEDMEQKINFIKCAALLNGARVRFQMKGDVELEGKVNEVLDEVSDSLLQKANCYHIRKNLRKVSEGIYQKLEMQRDIVKELLTTIPMIKSYYNGQGGEGFMSRIQAVQTYSREITISYKYLMQGIADTCIELLGRPPCEFAMVALGSFAREEITLYSDFEHVIVLDDEVQSMQDSEEIREYFRWFATMFQVVIIGLGETFIRSVGVKSLNDFYANERARNWYYDAYTPCGIAFDGMVPHSCNNPLGRQEKTRARPHKVELIQSAKKMAQYLSKDEEIKNGYYLKDMLLRTAFVHGSIEVYETFLRHSADVLQTDQADTIISDQLDKIRENVNTYIRAAGAPYREQEDVKQSIYRPMTALLSYMARMHLPAHSVTTSFDIVAEFQQQGIFPEALAQQVKYGVAVALEVRMKVYSFYRNQRAPTTNQHSAELVGMKALVDCREVVNYLCEAARSTMGWGERAFETKYIPARSNRRHKVAALYNMKQFDEAIILADKVTGSHQDHYSHEVMMIKGRCYYGQALSLPHEDERHQRLSKAAETFEDVLKMPLLEVHASLKKACFEELAECYKMLSKGQLHSITSSAGHAWRVNYLSVSENSDEIAIIAGTIGDRYEQAIEKISQKLGRGEMEDARTQLKHTSIEIVDKGREIGKAFMPVLLSEIVYIQARYSWLEDALETIDLLFENTQGYIPDIPSYIHHDKAVRKRVGGYLTFSCLLEAMEHFKAVYLFCLGKFDVCLAHIKSTTIYKKNWAHALVAGKCLLLKARNASNMEARAGRYVEEALTYFRRIQPCADFENWYNEALLNLLFLADSRTMIRHLRETPTLVKRSTYYQAILCNFLTAQGYISFGDRESSRQNWHRVQESFPEDLVCPFGFLAFSRFFMKVTADSEKSGRNTWLIPLNESRERFVETHRIFGDGEATRKYNKAIERFSYLHIREAAVLLWEVLISVDKRSFLFESSMNFFLASLVLAIVKWGKFLPFCCKETAFVIPRKNDKSNYISYLLVRSMSRLPAEEIARLRLSSSPVPKIELASVA